MEVLFSCVNEPETQGWDTLPQLSDAELRDLAEKLPKLARHLIAQSMETSASVPPFTPPLYHEAPKQGGARMVLGEDSPSPEPSAGAEEVCVIMPAADTPPGDLPTHASSPPAELASDAAVNLAIEPTADDVPQPAEPAAMQPTPGTSAASRPSAPLPQPIPVSAPPAAPLAPQPAPPTPLAREAAFQLAANGPDIYRPVAAALGFASLDALATGIASCVELHTSDPAQRRAFAARAATFLRWHTAGMVRELPIVDEPVGPNESHPRLLPPQRRLSILLEPYLSERQMPLRALQLMRLGGRRIAGDGRQGLDFLRTLDQRVATRAQSVHARLRAWAIRRFKLGYTHNPDIHTDSRGARGYLTLWDAEQSRTPLQRYELRMRQPYVSAGYARRTFVADTMAWYWRRANEWADTFAAAFVQGIRNIGDTVGDLATLRAIGDEQPRRSLYMQSGGWRHQASYEYTAALAVAAPSALEMRTTLYMPNGLRNSGHTSSSRGDPPLHAFISGVRRWLDNTVIDVLDVVRPLRPHSRQWRIRHWRRSLPLKNTPAGASAELQPTVHPASPERLTDEMCQCRLRAAMRLTAALHRGFIPLPALDVRENPTHSAAWTLAESLYGSSGHKGDAAVAIHSLAVGLLVAGVTNFGDQPAKNFAYAARLALPALGNPANVQPRTAADNSGDLLTTLQMHGLMLDNVATHIGTAVYQVLAGRVPPPNTGSAGPAAIGEVTEALWRALHHVMPIDTAFRHTRELLFVRGSSLSDALAIGLHQAACRHPEFFAYVATNAQLQEWLAVLTRIILVQVRETRAIAAAALPIAPRATPATRPQATNSYRSPAAARRRTFGDDDWTRGTSGIAVEGNWMT